LVAVGKKAGPFDEQHQRIEGSGTGTERARGENRAELEHALGSRVRLIFRHI
jgi:hypothetical protein